MSEARLDSKTGDAYRHDCPLALPHPDDFCQLLEREPVPLEQCLINLRQLEDTLSEIAIGSVLVSTSDQR